MKLNEPVALGVPLNEPLNERVSPPGKDPEATDHVYGDVPPSALNVWEYDAPTVPAGSGEPVVIVGAAIIVRLKAFCELCGAARLFATLLSTTRTLKSNVPAIVGVPVSVPAGNNLNPGGRDPESKDHVYGGVEFPVARSVSL